jgi:mannitol/fructose-specific phosphotransferase system IIA component (Ntr-type)
MKEGDSSQKQVYHCELCDKWFCERHLKPKFPYFIDWETIFDVLGNPEIKALYYTEYMREGGHPDFVYWRRKFEALDIEGKVRDKLIQQAIDKMIEANPIPPKTVNPQIMYSETITTENKYSHHFIVPTLVYLNEKYRERLNNAKTLEEVEYIISDYYKHLYKKHWWQ